LGCNMNGNTVVTVKDMSYTSPQPTYPITFERPAALPIKYEVQLADSSSLPSNIVDLVQTAIINSFNGLDGTARARIGGLILASKYYAPVSAIGPEVSILSILIGTATPTLNSVSVGIDQVPTLSAADISVVLVP